MLPSAVGQGPISRRNERKSFHAGSRSKSPVLHRCFMFAWQFASFLYFLRRGSAPSSARSRANSASGTRPPVCSSSIMLTYEALMRSCRNMGLRRAERLPKVSPSSRQVPVERGWADANLFRDRGDSEAGLTQKRLRDGYLLIVE